MIFVKKELNMRTMKYADEPQEKHFSLLTWLSGHSLLLVPDTALGSYVPLTLADAGRKEVFCSLEWVYVSTYKMQVDRKKKAVNDRDNH